MKKPKQWIHHVDMSVFRQGFQLIIPPKLSISLCVTFLSFITPALLTFYEQDIDKRNNAQKKNSRQEKDFQKPFKSTRVTWMVRRQPSSYEQVHTTLE